MRIIAGIAKGRRLKAPEGKGTRPATDRVREAVFSILGSLVEGASVLDLYAGSGSYGLEALSRGAFSAVFVEKGNRALDALRANLEAVGLGGTVVSSTVGDFLARSSGTFELVFIDPPWPHPTASLQDELADLDHLLSEDAEVILSRRQGDTPPVVPVTWVVATDRRYGDTRILRYAKESG